jgi:signal transduction histidine kinase
MGYEQRCVLTEFLTTNREAIIARTRAKVQGRVAPRPTDAELQTGIPLFLDQLIVALHNPVGTPTPDITVSATQHGSDLLGMGFTVSQVVHDYGGLCQAITELAVERNAAISATEFQILNQCLDDAIARAVTEFGRQREQAVSDHGAESLGVLAHELRNQLNIAVIAFEMLKTGNVGPSGSTGAMLERSLRAMRNLVDRSFADVRIQAGMRRLEPVAIAELIEEVAVGAAVDAKSRGLQLTVGPVDHDIIVEVDRQHIASALGNLLQNAFKFTRPHSNVELRTRPTADRVLIEVADECGGLPPGKTDELFLRFAQRGADRTGLGLGLAISRQGVEESGGTIRVRNLPGTGCVFTVDLPRHRPPS